MAVDHLAVTLNGSVQNLGALAKAAGIGIDILASVWLHAGTSNTHVIYVGGLTSTVTSTNYGFRIEVPSTGIPPAPSIIEMSNRLFSLADIIVLGTNNEKLYVLMIR